MIKNLHTTINYNFSSNAPLIKIVASTGAHLGHKFSNTHPLMYPYGYGILHPKGSPGGSLQKKGKGRFIFDKRLILKNLFRSSQLIKELSLQGQHIWFIATRPKIAALHRTLFSQISLNNLIFKDKWVPGLLTNPQTNLSFHRPSLIVFFHGKGLENPILEANLQKIPVVAILDSDFSLGPQNISYPIPGNDDSLRSQYFYHKTLLLPSLAK